MTVENQAPRCPVCGNDRKAGPKGKPFYGFERVAWHLASKAIAGGRRHRAWIEERVDGPVLNRSALLKYVDILTDVVEAHQPLVAETPAGFLDEIDLKVEIATAAITVERRLSTYIREVLIEKYGKEDSGWWAQGVKKPIRDKCNSKMEDCRYREHPFFYTDLIDYGDIIHKNWILFEHDFKRLSPSYLVKKELIEDLDKFNELRHLVHGSRRTIPTIDDNEFVGMFLSAVHEMTSPA